MIEKCFGCNHPKSEHFKDVGRCWHGAKWDSEAMDLIDSQCECPFFKTSFDEWLRQAVDYYVGRREVIHDYRFGQGLFNYLSFRREDLSEQVRGGAIDPFYNNHRVPDFLSWVQKNW